MPMTTQRCRMLSLGLLSSKLFRIKQETECPMS